MKKLIITALFVIFGATTYAQSDTIPAFFKGCETQECYVQKIHEYIKDNLEYPQECEDNKIEGRVLISYDIDKEGNVVNVRLIKGVNPTLNKAAISMAENLPQHQPARQNGETVTYTYTLPISFILR